jgi:orotate phosphoribosyltransferase
VEQAILNPLSARKGHFLMESGHHGDRWFDLELLCHQPREVQRFALTLAERLSACKVDAVCGPLVEGAFVGLMVASHLGCEFAYSERVAQPPEDGLYPVGYRVPHALRKILADKRIAIVNDVINAGSAVKGTFADLQRCQAHVVAIGALLVLGDEAARFAAGNGVSLLSLASLENNLWTAGECPLCASGLPLVDPAEFAAATPIQKQLRGN